ERFLRLSPRQTPGGPEAELGQARGGLPQANELLTGGRSPDVPETDERLVPAVGPEEERRFPAGATVAGDGGDVARSVSGTVCAEVGEGVVGGGQHGLHRGVLLGGFVPG